MVCVVCTMYVVDAHRQILYVICDVCIWYDYVWYVPGMCACVCLMCVVVDGMWYIHIVCMVSAWGVCTYTPIYTTHMYIYPMHCMHICVVCTVCTVWVVCVLCAVCSRHTV